jgi:chitodextrinase
MPHRAFRALFRRILLNAGFLALGIATISLGGAAAAGGDVLLIGTQSVAGGTDTQTPGVAEAFRTTASTSGQVTSIQVYIGSPTAAASFSAGLYADASGHPGQLLGQGSGAANRGSWSAVQLGSAVTVTAGTTYWIAVLGASGDGKLAVRDANHGAASESSAQSTLTSLPGSWSTGAAASDSPLSAFGAGIAAQASPTTPPPDTTLPSTPANLSVSAATQTSATLSWSPSTDNVAVAGYDVYVDGATVGQTSSTNFTASALTCATTHAFAVDAYDAAGNHSSKVSVNASTSACVADTQAPSTPTGLKTTGATTSSVSLGWTASTDNVGVVGYDIYQDSILVGKTSSASYAASGLGCGTSHTFSIDAYDAAGNHSGKVSVSGTASACTDTQAPTAPTSLVSTGATATSISLSWSASTDNVGVVGYDVYLGSSQIDSFDATSYTVPSLTCGSSYSLAVDAFDAAGNHSTKTTLVSSTASCTASADPSGQPMPVGDITGWHQIFADNFGTENVPLGTTCGDPNGFPHTLTNWSAYPYPWKGTPTWGTYCPERTTSIHDGVMDIWLHSESVGGTMLHLIDAPMPKIAGYTDTNGQLYGRYVIRYEEPSAFSMFHASWLLWPNSGVWPGDGEIDYPEGDTNSGTTQAFMHWQGGTSGASQDAYSTGVPMYGVWHTAVIEWLPSRVTFILDGKIVGNSTDTTKIPSTPMHFVIQNGGSFSVSSPDNTSQGHIYIDWVAIYKPA